MSYVKALFDLDNFTNRLVKTREPVTKTESSTGLIQKPFDLEIPEVETPKTPFSYEYLNLKALEERIQEAKDTGFADEGTGPSTVESTPDVKLSKASKTIDLKGKEGFIAELYPTAIEVGKATGVDPRIIVAQAALETGWGKHAPGNNYFGIKSHGTPEGQVLTTKEVVGGKTITIKDSFRKFNSPKDSVRGYGEFIASNPRYKEFSSAQTLEEQVQALGRSGYATDPDYANKIYSIATGLPPISDQGDVSFVQPVKSPFTTRRGK